MLNTLIKIGKWQSQGKGQWDRFLDYPKVQNEDKNGNKISNYTLPILFDLDKKKVILSACMEYDEVDVEKLKCLQLIARRGKSFYVTVHANKISQLYKAFFGKESSNGEMVEFIRNLAPSLLTEKLEDILNQIYALKDEFLKVVNPEGDENFPIKALEQAIGLGNMENVVLITTMIKSKQHGFPDPVYFSKINDYQNVLSKQYFPESSKPGNTAIKKKLCYASGNHSDDVEGLNLTTRYSLNKMFVTETKNYASHFSDKNFEKNYQVSKANQEKLDYASDYLLNQGFKARIANIDHVIIPQVRFGSKIDLEMALSWVKKKSDILFQFNNLKNLAENIKDEVEDIFWINFVAFESDGNFFKSTEIIKDVSNFHFLNVIQKFSNVDWELKEKKFTDWDTIMLQYGKSGGFFNLNSVYTLIPLRKEKEKKNKALDLFKTILENRKVNIKSLYDYFSDLILCHWYERYNSYTNVPKSSKDYFRKSVRDSVFKYHAFIKVLKKLNLINMEETNLNSNFKTGVQYDIAIQDFFDTMEIMNKDHKAMFYLGRILNRVEWIQLEKKIKKTVIHLVNFNGLDESNIERLYEDLFNKARQHNSVGVIKHLSGQFHAHFKRNDWSLNPKEALFYLLSGYSFMVKKNEAEEQIKVETED